MAVQRYDIPVPSGGFEERYWRIANSPVLNDHTGEVEYIIFNLTDVTRIEQAELEIRNNRKRVELFSITTHDVLWEWDVVNNLWWWNQNIEKLYGYPAGPAANGTESWESCIHPTEKKPVKQSLLKSMELREPEWKSEFRFRRADGTYAM
jgi:PAS domain S-box-containing protein